MASVTSQGLGSGLDIGGIVTAMVNAEREPQVFQLDKQETELQAKLSSFGIFKSALSDFKSSLSGLTQSSQFSSLTATSSDSKVVSATVSSNADIGQYNLEAKQQAKAHSLASNGFADVNTAIGTGTMTIKFGKTTYDAGSDSYTGFTQNGSKGTLSLTIDSTNNTLVGMRDAINNAKAGVNASIIYDGTANRLVLSSSDSGADNSMQISVSDSSLNAFRFDATSTDMQQTLAAQDAILSINGLDVSNASNNFKDTLKGVTFNLEKVELGKIVTVDIAQSSSDLVTSLQGFTDSFNELVKSVDTLTQYDPASSSGSALLGDATVRSGMSQIRSVLSGIVSGLEDSSVRTLSDLGLAINRDGTIEFNSSKLTTAMTDDPDGVAAVFSVLGRPSHQGVTYFSSTDSTETGKYLLNVTQAATQGTLQGSSIGAAPYIVTASANDTFNIRVDGTSSGQITLTAQTYNSGDALAAEIQSRINGDAELKAKNAEVEVTFDSTNNRFDIKSAAYGAGSKLEIFSSTAGSLGLGVVTGSDGTDVAGTVNGVVAEGKGQYLTAENGLKLLVEGDLLGNLGSVDFSRGMMEKLDNVLDGMLSSKGSVTTKTKGLQKSLDQITEERIALNERIIKLEQRLSKRFNAMDSLLGQLQGTSSFLAQQLQSLPYNNLSNSRNQR